MTGSTLVCWKTRIPEQSATLFPGVNHCLIFAAGVPVFLDSVIEVIGKGVECETIVVDAENEFVPRLESAVFAMRNRLTGVGLLPNFWELSNDVDWAFGDVVWQSDRKMVEIAMTRRLAVRDFFALQGALFEPNRSLLGMLPYRGRFTFKTLALRPKIEILQHLPAEQQLALKVIPIPELGYVVKIPCAGDPEKLVQRLREALRNPEGADMRRMRYSAEPADDRQPQDELSSLTEMLAPFSAPLSHSSEVVLVQRHFLCPQSTVSAQ